MNTMQDVSLLRMWAKNVWRGCKAGAFGDSVEPDIKLVSGPRAGALLVNAGLSTGKLLSKLGANEGALLRQSIPYNFTGTPVAFMQGRSLRLECGWPPGLGTSKVRLSALGRSKGVNRWTVGVNERGAVVSMSLSDNTPHFLVAGTTGAGKSVALRGAALQLANGHNDIVLLDGKRGSSLGIAQQLRGVVGPVAYTDADIKGALGWVHNAMIERYDRMANGDTLDTRLVVLFDEFQEFKTDDTVTGLLAKIASQGRDAKVHLLAATQHPTVDAFGESSTRRELTGRLALTVTDSSASQVVVGDSLPRADRLLGCGDAYAIAPGTVHRVQVAFVDATDFDTEANAGWLVDDWPMFSASDIADGPSGATSQPTNQELALSIRSAAAGEGRGKLLARYDDAGLNIGSTVGRRLLAQGRDLWQRIADTEELRGYYG